METEIIEKEEELRLAMLKSDVKKLDELLDDSLIFTAPDGNLVTKKMDLETHRSKIQKMAELNPEEQTVQIHDTFAAVSVKMKIVGTYDKYDISGLYRYLRIWAKINNSWKIVAGSVVKIG